MHQLFSYMTLFVSVVSVALEASLEVIDLDSTRLTEEEEISNIKHYNIRIYHECEGGIEKSVQRITDCHHKAWLLMTIGDPRDRIFYPTLTQIMDYFSS